MSISVLSHWQLLDSAIIYIRSMSHYNYHMSLFSLTSSFHLHWKSQIGQKKKEDCKITQNRGNNKLVYITNGHTHSFNSRVMMNEPSQRLSPIGREEMPVIISLDFNYFNSPWSFNNNTLKISQEWRQRKIYSDSTKIFTKLYIEIISATTFWLSISSQFFPYIL